MRTGYVVTWASASGRWFYAQEDNTAAMQDADVMALDYAVAVLKSMSLSFGNVTIWRVREQFSWVVVDD